MISITVPIKIVSASSISEHWSKTYKRNKAYSKAIRAFLNTQRPATLPCVVKLTRIAPRKLDRDNIWTALKHPIDVVCDWLIPGLAPGRADGNEQITLQYSQEKSAAGVYGLRIEIIEIRLPNP